MSHSDSEEQFEVIKEFLAKTWKIIVLIIVIGLLAIWGWRYWHSHNAAKTVESSDRYELLISKLNAKDPNSVNELTDFAKDNDTIYSVFANMKAAQFYVENLKDYNGALSLLVDASKKTDVEAILSTINLRIARLQYQLGNYEESLKTLDSISNSNWAAIVNDIRGDVLVKMDKYQEACNAYLVSLASNPTSDIEKNVKMKLNQAEYLREKQAVEQEKIAKEKEASASINNATPQEEQTQQ